MAIGSISGYGYSSSYNYYDTQSLYSLMKKVDEVRSSSYQKQLKEQINSGSTDWKTILSDLQNGTSSSSQIGTVSSEMALSSKASELSKAAESVKGLSAADIADDDTLYSAVSNFTDAYNATIDAMSKSDSVDALSEGISMTNSVKMYANSLKRIGITIGSDNKLTVNEDTLKSADKNVVKSCLTGNYSSVDRIATKADKIASSAKSKAKTTALSNYLYGGTDSSSSSLYGVSTGYGSYSTLLSALGTGSLFDLYA